LVDFEYQIDEDTLIIVAHVRSTSPPSQETVETLAAALNERLDQAVTLEVVSLPVIRSSNP
jgi:F0F1-type ATP synthase delta subunit